MSKESRARNYMLNRLTGIWRADTWVKPYFSRYKKTMLVSLGLGVLTLLFATLLMLMSGFLISYASLPPEMGLFSLYIPIGFVQLFGIGKPFFGYFERLASHDWVLRMTSSLRKKLYGSFEQERIVGARSLQMGEALGLLSEDISHVQNLYLRTVFPLVTAWAVGGLVVIAVGAMSVPCAVMLLVGFVVIAALLPLQALLVNGARTARVKALKAQLYASAYDNVMGIGDWVCAQRKEDFRAAVSRVAGEINGIEKGLAESSRRRNLLVDALFALIVVALLAWAGGFFGAADSAAPAAFAGSLSDNQPATWIAAVVLGFFPLLEAFQPLSDATAAAAGHLDSIERLNAFERPAQDEGSDIFPVPDGVAICLDGVSFSYDASSAGAAAGAGEAADAAAGDVADGAAAVACDVAGARESAADAGAPADACAPLLSGVSLTIEHGQKVAILGASGSGKSTLLHLVRGDLAPSSGAVTLGGVSTAQLNAAGRIHQYVGYMQQSSYLFAQTLRGNLKIGNPKVTDDQAIKALQKVCLQSLLDRLPDGLDTSVDESGLRFSGGERQRIALARLLLAQTPVVLLDEPTVSLDPLTETKLLDTIFDVLADRTVIMVTHHLCGIGHMDRVLLVQDGRILLDGSPKELAKSSELFQRLLAFDRGLKL